MAMAAPGAALAALPAVAAGPSSKGAGRPEVMQRPSMLFFDVNETLLDLTPLNHSVASALAGRTELVRVWFTTMLQYSLVNTVANRYAGFGQIGAATMVMVAQANGIDLTIEQAQAAIAPIRSLPPHPDVIPGLQTLRNAGFRMVSFTNSPPAVAEAQLENAGISSFFEQRLSIEEILLYKPHAHAYRWASYRMGVPHESSMLIAAHGWDVAGAIWAGWRAAFLSRQGAQLYPLGPTPEIVRPDLVQAAEALIALGA